MGGVSMKPLKWREPWALTRRQRWRFCVYLFFRSMLLRLYFTAAIVVLAAIWGLLHWLYPMASFPLRQAVFSILYLPCMALLCSPMFVLMPQTVIVHERYVNYDTGKDYSSIKPGQLQSWSVQERKGYRRLVLRYMGPRGVERKRAYWLADSVDRADLDRRMYDFAARGAAERARGGNA
jgi:hypothetical protein